MNKLVVVGDPDNTKFCSSEIIISSLNNGLKLLDLYDENGQKVVYDCLAQTYRYETNYIICPYETNIPSPIIENAKDRYLIGVSNQNKSFFLNGGFPKEKTHVMLLGVDSKLWSPSPIKHFTFRFGMMCDSNTRAAYGELIVAFGQIFSNRNDVELYIKDRWATPAFKTLVKSMADFYKVNIIHDDEHVTSKIREVEIYNDLDCHVFLNRTSTFAMTVAQGMAMQKPTIVMGYSGPRDYCNELNACLVDFTFEEITDLRVMQLVQQGYRNYLFTSPHLFKTPPIWAQPSIDSIKKCLWKVYSDKDYRENIAYNARATVESLTWERAALNLAWIVNL